MLSIDFFMYLFIYVNNNNEFFERYRHLFEKYNIKDKNIGPFNLPIHSLLNNYFLTLYVRH